MPAESSSASADASLSANVRLDHASVMTTDLDEAVAFYVNLIGLSLQAVEDDPVRDGRKRALLTDAQGQDVIALRASGTRSALVWTRPTTPTKR
jgi:glyoxylase I family protein